MFNIIQIAIITLLAIILLVNITLAGSRLIFKSNLPTFLGFSQAMVLSGSMEPTFFAGDMLIFKSQDEYESTDIVIFEQDNTLITHRIIEVKEDGFITKGDANNVADEKLIVNDNIKGKLLFILPNFGAMIEFLKTPLGIFLIVILGFLLIEIPSILKKRKEK